MTRPAHDNLAAPRYIVVARPLRHPDPASSPLRTPAPLAVAPRRCLPSRRSSARRSRPASPAPSRPSRTSSLSWVRLPGAEACIGSRALAAAVERRLQREVFVPPSRAAMAVEGRVERAPEGFRAVITVSNEAGVALGSREIHRASPICATMDDNLALVIAVMIDPEAALAPRVPASTVPRPAPAPPLRPAGEPSSGAGPAPPGWSVSLQAGGVAMLGLMPRVSGGVLIRSHIEPPRLWAFEVEAVLFEQVVTAEQKAGGRRLPARGGVPDACAR